MGSDAQSNKVFRTRELDRTEQPTSHAVWFRLTDGSRLTVEMSLAGLLQLQGLVNRAVESLGGAQPNEMNVHPHVTEASKGNEG